LIWSCACSRSFAATLTILEIFWWAHRMDSRFRLSQLAKISQGNGASFIYREDNSRYIGVQNSIEGRDLERAVRDGQAAVNNAVTLPQGYWMVWGGEYSQFLEAKSQMYFIVPLALVLIFMILFALYGNFKFRPRFALGVIMTEPVGALVALKAHAYPVQRSSVLGLLALLGVSVETASFWFVHQQAEAGGDGYPDGHAHSFTSSPSSDHDDRPGGMPRTPAGGSSTGIGSDTQKPFAIVIVAA